MAPRPYHLGLQIAVVVAVAGVNLNHSVAWYACRRMSYGLRRNSVLYLVFCDVHWRPTIFVSYHQRCLPVPFRSEPEVPLRATIPVVTPRVVECAEDANASFEPVVHLKNTTPRKIEFTIGEDED